MPDLSVSQSERRDGQIAYLRGPIHGLIQTIRGMCTDEEPYTKIDGKLGVLDERVYALIDSLEAEDA